MIITEVRAKLTSDKDDKLRAFCSITVDNEFVIRDLKVIEGSKGMFVAMPSRKLTARCPRCGEKNHLRASFCNGCGVKLSSIMPRRDASGRVKLHADIAHPINSICRENIQSRVLSAFREEIEHAKSPGYSPHDIYDKDELAIEDEISHEGRPDKDRPDKDHPDKGRPDKDHPDKGRPDKGRPDKGRPNDNFSEGLFT